MNRKPKPKSKFKEVKRKLGSNERLRERFKHAIPGGGFVTIYLNEQGTSYGLGESKTYLEHEYILDTVQKKKEGMKAFFNPCFHDSSVVSDEPISELQVWNTEFGTPNIWEFNSSNSLRPRNLWEVLRELPSGYDDRQISDFNTRAEHHFKTAIDVEVLSINALIDVVNVAKQFNGIFKGIIERAAKFRAKSPRAAAYYRYRVRKRFRDNLKDPKQAHKKISDGWLIWNFAVKPSLKDIRNVTDSVKKLQKRLEFLRDHNGDKIVVDYREGWKARDGVINSSAGILFPDCPPGVTYVKPVETGLDVEYVVESRLCAHALVQFDINPALLYSESAIYWAMAVYHGLLALGSTVWEGIPFSFVIDWFLSEKQREFPNYLDYSPFKDAIIHDVYHSVQSRASGQVFVTAPPATLGADDQRLYVGTYMYKSYTRTHGYPLKGNPLFRVPWSGYLASLASALFLQRIKVRRS